MVHSVSQGPRTTSLILGFKLKEVYEFERDIFKVNFRPFRATTRGFHMPSWHIGQARCKRIPLHVSVYGEVGV